MKVYGPVPSWRLGNSLGVDIVKVPKGKSKVCSYDCVYCQLGHNGYKVNTTAKIPIQEKEFEELRTRIKETKPEYITFSGNGEPTLNLSLGYAARRIKQMTDIPIAVLTNASFFYDGTVRKGLNECDLVIAKIDAPNQELFERINRPYKGIILDNIIKGIKLLKTNVAIQTLLFSYGDLTNADNVTVERLIEVYKDINHTKPIKVFLGTAYRPSGSYGLNPIGKDRLEEIASKMERECGIKVIPYRKFQAKAVIRDLRPEELKTEILKLVERRPCTEEDISTRFDGKDVSGILSDLVKKGILVDEFLRTSDPNIFAAGDCAEKKDFFTRKKPM